jgi:alcohol dehydrogenase
MNPFGVNRPKHHVLLLLTRVDSRNEECAWALFRIGMKQELHTGKGSIARLGDALLRRRSRSLFLLTGKSSFDTSGADSLLKPFLRGYGVARFCDFQANPNVEDLREGIRAFRQIKADLIVAVGGGSVIDMAKLINTFSSCEADPEDAVRNRRAVVSRSAPMIAIPTTSGSGSEATQFATMYIQKVKHSVSSQLLLPDVAIIDPVFTARLPARLTAISGMDALSQAIEAYWSVQSTAEARGLASQAMGMIQEHLRDAVFGAAEKSRVKMSLAATLAGQAINISKTTGPHALSYALTARFNVPHGAAVALTLSRIMDFNYGVMEADLRDLRGTAYVRRTIEEIAAYLGCDSVMRASREIERIMADIGLATSFRELGIDKAAAVDAVVREMNEERLANNPRILTRSAAREILESIP